MLSKYLLIAVRVLSVIANAADASEELAEIEKREFLEDVVLAELEKRDDVTYVITDMVTVTSETDIIVSFVGPYVACGTSSMHISTTA